MERSEKMINVVRSDDTAKYIDRIDRSDAEPWFVDAVSENDEGLYEIRFDDKVAGLSYLEDGPAGFLYVYIFPAYRNNGYGDAAVTAMEQQIKAAPLISIMTSFRSDCTAAIRFAQKHGYVKKYMSDLMEYMGGVFPEEELPIRHYRDEDYPEAFAMYAEAFHVMRIGTGCFPDSKPAQPDEEERKYWAEHADDGYVYLSGNEIVGHARIEGNELDVVSIKISHQGRGYGRVFVKFLVNRIIEKNQGNPTLWCVVGNDKAKSLYDSLGFQQICREVFAYKKIDGR
jgi:mycothiol synthase